VCTMELCEALVLYHATNWVNVMQFDNLDFEFDLKIVVDVFNKDQVNITDFGYVISSCRCIFAFVPVSLAQLVRTMHNICKIWGSNSKHHKKKM